MRQLTEREESVFINAVTGGSYDRDGFAKVVSVIRYGKANFPIGVEYSTREWPNYIREWRERKEWSLDLLASHQSAAKAAHAEYWRVFMMQNLSNSGQ